MFVPDPLVSSRARACTPARQKCTGARRTPPARPTMGTRTCEYPQRQGAVGDDCDAQVIAQGLLKVMAAESTMMRVMRTRHRPQ